MIFSWKSFTGHRNPSPRFIYIFFNTFASENMTKLSISLVPIEIKVESGYYWIQQK